MTYKVKKTVLRHASHFSYMRHFINVSLPFWVKERKKKIIHALRTKSKAFLKRHNIWVTLGNVEMLRANSRWLTVKDRAESSGVNRSECK